MRRRPFHEHTQHTMRQVPKRHGSRLDLQYSPIPAVSHVEVRWRMIVINTSDEAVHLVALGHAELDAVRLPTNLRDRAAEERRE